MEVLPFMMIVEHAIQEFDAHYTLEQLEDFAPRIDPTWLGNEAIWKRNPKGFPDNAGVVSLTEAAGYITGTKEFSGNPFSRKMVHMQPKIDALGSTQSSVPTVNAYKTPASIEDSQRLGQRRSGRQIQLGSIHSPIPAQGDHRWTQQHGYMFQSSSDPGPPRHTRYKQDDTEMDDKSAFSPVLDVCLFEDGLSEDLDCPDHKQGEDEEHKRQPTDRSSGCSEHRSNLRDRGQPQRGQHDASSPRALCRKDIRCINAHCTFGHRSPTAPADVDVSLEQSCRFGLQCNNQACRRTHPSPAAVHSNGTGKSLSDNNHHHSGPSGQQRGARRQNLPNRPTTTRSDLMMGVGVKESARTADCLCICG